MELLKRREAGLLARGVMEGLFAPMLRWASPGKGWIGSKVGTSNVLEAANETKLVRKVVFAGSSTYYGNQAFGPNPC